MEKRNYGNKTAWRGGGGGGGGEGGVLPCISYIGMCGPKVYGF